MKFREFFYLWCGYQLVWPTKLWRHHFTLSRSFFVNQSSCLWAVANQILYRIYIGTIEYLHKMCNKKQIWNSFSALPTRQTSTENGTKECSTHFYRFGPQGKTTTSMFVTTLIIRYSFLYFTISCADNSTAFTKQFGS